MVLLDIPCGSIRDIDVVLAFNLFSPLNKRDRRPGSSNSNSKNKSKKKKNRNEEQSESRSKSKSRNKNKSKAKAQTETVTKTRTKAGNSLRAVSTSRRRVVAGKFYSAKEACFILRGMYMCEVPI